jgi:hypothetical protein
MRAHLRCPYGVPSTRIGRVLGGLSVGAALVTGGFAATAAYRQVAHYAGILHRAYNETDSVKARTRDRLKQRMEKETERMRLEDERIRLEDLRLKKFNDAGHYSWHFRTTHGWNAATSALLTTMCAYATARELRYAKAASNFCRFALRWNMSAVAAGFTIVFLGAAIGNAHAAYCKANAPLEDAKSARLRHEQLALYRIPYFKDIVGIF